VAVVVLSFSVWPQVVAVGALPAWTPVPLLGALVVTIPAASSLLACFAARSEPLAGRLLIWLVAALAAAQSIAWVLCFVSLSGTQDSLFVVYLLIAVGCGLAGGALGVVALTVSVACSVFAASPA
jgi:hypothetical protein